MEERFNALEAKIDRNLAEREDALFLIQRESDLMAQRLDQMEHNLAQVLANTPDGVSRSVTFERNRTC